MSAIAPNFGPKPWLQRNWDLRAALNFMCGGAGAGLLIALPLIDPVLANARIILLCGLALIGIGLTAVWLEIGRKLRFMNVFRNPNTSWMSREAFVATLVFGLGLAALITDALVVKALTGAAALGFVYCQARILQAAKGIPAWRETALLPFMLVTSFTEGMGLLVILAANGSPLSAVYLLFVLAALRAWLWLRYARKAAPALAPRALRAIVAASKITVWLGSVVPLALLVIAFWRPEVALPMIIAAGALAFASGLWCKFVIVRRAAYNQGFSLQHVPRRGAE